MKHFASYDPATGKMYQYGTCSDGDLGIQPGTVIECGPEVRDSTHYVLSGVVTARGTLTATLDKATIVADGVDTATLSPLPNPCEVSVNGSPVTVTDGSLEVTAALVGTYRIVIDIPQYKTHVWLVEAV